MSWDAYLHCDCCGSAVVEQNYTHNCNGMANAVLYPDYEQQPVFDEVFKPKVESWWKRLDGLPGPEGAALLDRIIKGLEADPQRFRAMSPKNGWGDYDSFLATLRKMRDSVPECHSTWTCHG